MIFVYYTKKNENWRGIGVIFVREKCGEAQKTSGKCGFPVGFRRFPSFNPLIISTEQKK